MFVQAYLNTAQDILKEYRGEQPLHIFLKNYFGFNKKFGSRDRKYITHLCYCFFRLGQSIKEVPVLQRLLVGIFLCDQKKTLLLEKLDAGLNERVEDKLDDKVVKLNGEYGFKQEDIFPFKNFVSDQIEQNEFYRSFLIQPLVFLRIRPGGKMVKEKLSNSAIPFQSIDDHCLAIEPATKLAEVLQINKEAVIQDLSSQQVLRLLIQYADKKKIKKAWDCCAASGGKSILLKDSFPDVQLCVSDIRETILINLAKRLQEAGIKVHKKILVDLSKSSIDEKEQFDLIICDAPCSGSGTWARTPEQIYFFKEEKISEYALLQKKIVSNSVKNLTKGGFFLYITCSVFKNENEDVVKFIEEKTELNLVNMEYIKGYNVKADTLFTALFTL